MLNQLNLFYYFYETDIVKNIGADAADAADAANATNSSTTTYQHIASID